MTKHTKANGRKIRELEKGGATREGEKGLSKERESGKIEKIKEREKQK